MICSLSIGWIALVQMGSASFGMAQDVREKVVLDLGGGVKMEFVWIREGRFMRGSSGDDAEKPPHEVTIAKCFWMQTTEVTQAQWMAVMGKNPSQFKGADLPVETVDWRDCQAFMEALNRKAKDLLESRKATLPTEAEWEYACRAGEHGKWGFGNDEKKLREYAWYERNSWDKTHPVGQKRANRWGLFDMHGNVWEWCEDWFGTYPSEAVTDPTGPPKGEDRCKRGGSWKYDAFTLRAAFRGRSDPLERCGNDGFRVVLR